MISFCFHLSITFSLTSLNHSAHSLCSIVQDQILLQKLLLSSTLGFTSSRLLFSSIYSNKSFWLLWKPLLYKFLSSYISSFVVLALILSFTFLMTTLRLSSHSNFFRDLLSLFYLTVCLSSTLVIVVHAFLILRYWFACVVSTMLYCCYSHVYFSFFLIIM